MAGFYVIFLKYYVKEWQVQTKGVINTDNRQNQMIQSNTLDNGCLRKL